MSVFLKPVIAHLGKAEHPLDDPDRMFDPGPHFGLGPIFRPLDLIHDTAVAVAAIDEILGLWSMLPDHRPLAAVGLITPHPGLLPMQQIGQHRAVGDIGRRHHRRVDQLGTAVDPEMRLYAEVPLVALLGLMHLGITRLLGVLGRGRRTDDGGVDDRAGRHLQVRYPPGAVAPRRTAGGPDRAPPAGGGSGTPWSRPAPARVPGRCRQNAASPANRRAPLPPRDRTD